MPAPYTLTVTVAQRAELRAWRDHAAVAHHGGLKPHHEDTVCGWLRRYLAEGRAGLRIRKGRGRKPATFRGR